MFSCLIEDFRIVPYVRMTRKGKWFKQRAKRYLKNQHQLSWLIKLKGTGKAEIPCFLFAHIVQTGLRSNSDWDNYAKAVSDALVKAGVLPDDCFRYILGAYVRLEKGDKNRIEIYLNRELTVRTKFF